MNHKTVTKAKQLLSAIQKLDILLWQRMLLMLCNICAFSEKLVKKKYRILESQFDVLLTVHLSIILVINQLDA